MTDKQFNQATQHIANADVIVEQMDKILKDNDDQEAVIILESLNILPTLKSNISEAFEIMRS